MKLQIVDNFNNIDVHAIFAFSNLQLKAGAAFFTAGCNEEVFSSKSWKNGVNMCCRFREERKTRLTPTH